MGNNLDGVVKRQIEPIIGFHLHTNRDTYDKIVFDDVQKNVILTAILAYKASEDPSFFNREKSVLPLIPFTGQPGKWPTPNPPTRKGGVN